MPLDSGAIIPTDYWPRRRIPKPGGSMDNRRGASAIIIALSLVVLLGAGALVIDMGHVTAVQAELQAAADSAAHAGARQLDGTVDGTGLALTLGQSFSQANEAGKQLVTLDGTDGSLLQLGVWDDGAFTPNNDATQINAVRALARRADLVPWLSSAAFGVDALAASAEAIAVHEPDGAGEVECFLPLGVADCTLTDLYADGVNFVDFVLNPPGVDNVGWARPEQSPSASWVRDQLRVCQYDGALAVGDDINLNNGAMTSAMQEIADIINEDSTTSWQTELWGDLPSPSDDSAVNPGRFGYTIEGPIPTFNAPEYCEDSGGGFNGTEIVSGFVWASIYDVETRGNVAERTIRVRLEVMEEREVGSGGGGPDYGVVGRDVVMVR